MRTGPILILLALVALPVAVAQSTGDAWVDEKAGMVSATAWGTANGAPGYANGVVDQWFPQGEYGPFLPPEAPPPEEEAPEEYPEHEADRAGHAHPSHGDEPAPAEQEPAPQQDNGLVGRVSRLVPIPVELPGPAPRIDLDAIERVVNDFAPLAPAPSAMPDGAEAPIAPAGAPVGPAPLAPEAAAEIGAVGLAVAAAANTGAPVAAALWERFRRVGWLALLYTRIAKERLLDHGSRERLLDAIRAKPGVAMTDLADASGIPRNTVTYHLRVLEREGLVSSTRNGRTRLFFAPGALPQRANADALATLRHETTLAVARKVGQNPGVDQKALCVALGLSPSLAHWHADRLAATGIVDKKREGRSVRYYPGSAFSLVEGRAA